MTTSQFPYYFVLTIIFPRLHQSKSSIHAFKKSFQKALNKSAKILIFIW